jgi:PIN domain nuclease of toxin-antitoxin system
MTLLLDTHFLIWILLGSRKLKRYSWIEDHRPWGVSPASVLEIQFLSEVGRLDLRAPEFYDTLFADSRFVVDEPPFLGLVRHALALTWTRDPFDRLLAGHSSVRRVPLCTLDRTMRRHHPYIAKDF